jgi:hypothetical protein
MVHCQRKQAELSKLADSTSGRRCIDLQPNRLRFLKKLAETTRLELATSAVTGNAKRMVLGEHPFANPRRKTFDQPWKLYFAK